MQTLLFSYITLPHPFHFSLVFSLLVPVPEAIDAYINASKTVLKQGEPLTVNCTVHGVELVNFSWDIPNRGVSRSAIVPFSLCDHSKASGPSPNYIKMWRHTS